MPSFNVGDKVTHPATSKVLMVKPVESIGRIRADYSSMDLYVRIVDDPVNFTLHVEPIRFGDRVRYVDKGDPDAAHIVTGTSITEGGYTIGFGLDRWYMLTAAEVLERRITEAGQ